MKKLVLFLCSLAFLLYSAPVFAISVTTTDDASTLIGTILGSGITVVSGSESYTGASIASGTFTGGTASGIGMESGIILTSGDATLAEGPNTSDGAGSANGYAGDALLDALIPGYTTYDATLLTFDFISSGGDLFFNYVFASDEYNEYVNSDFNDVFAFFVDGVNIALVPGTTDPVSVNNVNGGNPLGTGASNSAYYNNNDLSDGGPFYDLEYDGFTDVFIAQALGLSAGTHTMMLAIADAGDSILDSGVFIQAGTFSDTITDDTTVPEPATMLLLGTGLVGLASFRRRINRK